MTRLPRLLAGVIFAALPGSAALAGSSTAFEYYHGDYGHYFVTALPAEIAALDAGVFFGWSRTGLAFDVLAVDEASSSNVCRFWSGQTFVTKSSHFYTPFDWECAIVKRNRDWTYEGEVFSMMLPDAAGNCRGGTVPLYRLYNDGKTGAPNHRYTTSLDVRNDMTAQGWIPEGSGTIGVIGCVPVHTPTKVDVVSPIPSPWVGETVLLSAVARDASGGVIPGTSATWSVSNPAVATISAIGALTAIATGTVDVTATVNGVSGSASLTVVPMPRISVTVGTTKEVAFAYKTDHCPDSDLDFPDLPTHIVRAEDGSLVLFASAAPRYYVSRGADFNSLKRDCSQPVLVSPDLPTPQSYQNREWISAVYREGNRWHAIISNEFHDPVATCQSPDPGWGNICLYLSATYAVSTDGARSFLKPFAPAHVVAPPPNAWAAPPPGTLPNTGRLIHEGYSAPTSIVSKGDGYFYGAVGLTPSKFNPATYEMCLIRTDNLNDPASWRAWDGSGFNVRMTSPYATGRPAAPFCKLSHEPPGSNITFNTYFDRYLEVGTYKRTVDGKPFLGVYFSLSADLLHWSAEHLIVEIVDEDNGAYDPQNQRLLEPVPVLYVTLIDHADTSINFERPGRTPYLYYVRFNDWGYDRDLVRVPLTFTRVD